MDIFWHTKHVSNNFQGSVHIGCQKLIIQGHMSEDIFFILQDKYFFGNFLFLSSLVSIAFNFGHNVKTLYSLFTYFYNIPTYNIIHYL